jgi:hypothetical protein
MGKIVVVLLSVAISLSDAPNHTRENYPRVRQFEIKPGQSGYHDIGYNNSPLTIFCKVVQPWG